MRQRIILFLLTAVLALAAGALLPRQWIEPVFNYSGYYFVLTAFCIWAVLDIRIISGRIGLLVKTHYAGLLISAGVMALAFHL